MGKVGAASFTAALRSSFPKTRIAVLAGICGGVPFHGDGIEVCLGDVIISRTLVQYDLGRQDPSKFVRKDTIHDNLGRPNHDIRALLGTFQTECGLAQLQRGALSALNSLQSKATETGRQTSYRPPAMAEDHLFKPTYLHVHRARSNCGCSEIKACEAAASASCDEIPCEYQQSIPRKRLGSSQKQVTKVFVGDIASGDTVMKSGEHRDNLAKDLGVTALEMEGAGVWGQIPCIVVKGVCDYADSHKNDIWQPFAAAAAAAVTKALLSHYKQTDKSESSGRDAGASRFANFGAGQQFINADGGTMNNISGNGKQYNAHTMTIKD
ncbi:Aminodeoxyfutalosine nucleosidase [Colletotrichum shisoi]|uniref:Aminodeoxyfutalosine nucleosidase n=1 Tax=Colletotrichum shisoi TaxID=2078593 RepID=A0A5Q4BPJ9_9PEZI|nr:Aminodeoxyfutalosine nucleosidase [Colletotrichum shisoi]